MKDDWLMAIDAGGSFMKYAAVHTTGNVIGRVRQLPVDSSAGSEAILSIYSEVVSELMEEGSGYGSLPLGLGIATPGPFDFVNGKSLMTHKFASLYGVDLRGEITRRVGLPKTMRIVFIQDANAFLLGEYWVGAAKGYRSVAGVTIGTGLGYACITDGSLLVNKMGSPYMNLYLQRWNGGVLEDTASARGIVNGYIACRPDMYEKGLDALAVSRYAMEGDVAAMAAFEQLGYALGRVLAEPFDRLGVQCLVLGGQVSHSFHLFQEQLRKELTEVRSLQKVCVSGHLDSSSLLGAASMVLTGQEDCRVVYDSVHNG